MSQNSTMDTSSGDSLEDVTSSSDYTSTVSRSEEDSFGSDSVSSSLSEAPIIMQQRMAEHFQFGRSSSWSHRMSSFSILSHLTAEERSMTGRSMSLPTAALFSLHSCTMSPGSASMNMQMPKRNFLEILMLCMAYFAVEFIYAIETALTTPILLQLGLPASLYSIIWLASPFLGIVFTPFIGSASDHCRLRWGRRRPFLLAFFIGILISQALVLNGEDLGILLGDTQDHTIGLISTLVGVIMLDFCINSAVCPARAYIVDVCNPEDAQFAFVLRSFLSGLGGGVGYVMIGINWENSPLNFLGDQLQILFIFSTAISIVSFALNLNSIPETQLKKTLGKFYQDREEKKPLLNQYRKRYTSDLWRDQSIGDSNRLSYSEHHSIQNSSERFDSHYSSRPKLPPLSDFEIPEEGPMQEVKKEENSLAVMVLSVVKMPTELWLLCFNHFLGWMSFLSVLLFFTDYMGQAVFKGDPEALKGSDLYSQYQEGVQIGSWGLCVFQFSCTISAAVFSQIWTLIDLRTVYVFGQMVFAVCAGCMILVRDSVLGTLLLFTSFGVQFFILLTLPFALIAIYHQSKTYIYSVKGYERGVGIDMACAGLMVFLAQVVVSSILSPLITFFQSHVVILVMASSLGFCSAIFSALFVCYEVKPRLGPR